MADYRKLSSAIGSFLMQCSLGLLVCLLKVYCSVVPLPFFQRTKNSFQCCC
uniref:Uncharacterized protein n=1 Tax=Anguilla anguilla TaxID=7936 RepID=A0A0E9R8N6_ANGAN